MHVPLHTAPSELKRWAWAGVEATHKNMLIVYKFIDSPTITSVYPKIPIVTPVTSAMATFTVPEKYTGVVITCNAIGWPPPTLAWLSDSEQVIQPKFSHSIDLEGSGYSSIALQFFMGTSRSDSGRYTCIVSGSGSDTQSDSVLITLEVTTGEIPSDTTLECLFDSTTVFFQLHVLDSNCVYREQDAIEKVVDEISDVLIGGIISQCRECVISDDAIIVSHGPLCSDSESGATIFKGEISTNDAEITSSIFCGLTAWYQSMPLIRINNELKLVDQDCTLEVELLDLDSTESCTKDIITKEVVIGVVVILPVVLVLIIIVSTLLVIILMVCYKR